MKVEWQFVNAGEASIMVYARGVALDIANDAISQLLQCCQASTLPTSSLTASYDSLLVSYDPDRLTYLDMLKQIRTLTQLLKQGSTSEQRRLSIPVCYGTGDICDLEQVARLSGISVDQVIDCHSQTEYRVYAIGFAPGFAYLGSVDPRLHIPRMATPRTSVPAGSVAIAEAQTAIYPQKSPGGWHILGYCPAPVFQPLPEPHAVWKVGDLVNFRPVKQTDLATEKVLIDAI